MSGKQLSKIDAYALRRASCKMPVEGLEISAICRLLLDSVNPATEIGFKRFQDILSRNDEILRQILYVDPAAEFEFTTKLINANALKDLTRPEYALSEYAIYQSGLNAIVGASGSKKSFLALNFAGTLACQLEQGHVVYLPLEGLAGYSARWEAWKLHHRKSTERLYFYTESVDFMQSVQVDMLIEDLEPLQPRMVIIDTVARSMPSGDENSTKDMNAFIGQIDRFRAALGCGVLLVHHTGKDGKMRGSSALYAACDSVLFVQSYPDRIAVHNEYDKGGKNKYQKEAASLFLALRPIDVQIAGENVKSAVLVDAAQMIQDESEINSNQIMILEALDNTSEGMSIRELSEYTEIPTSSLYRHIESLVNRHIVFRTQNGLYYLNKLADSHDSHENPVSTRARARDSHSENENQLSMFGKETNGKKHQYTEGL